MLLRGVRIFVLTFAGVTCGVLVTGLLQGQTGWQTNGTTVYTPAGTKVGIGTPTPAVSLDVSAMSASPFPLFNGTLSDGHYSFRSSYVTPPASNAFSFYNETKVNVSIDSSRVFNGMTSVTLVPSGNSAYLGGTTVRGGQFRGQHSGAGVIGSSIGVSGVVVNDSLGTIVNAQAGTFNIFNSNAAGIMQSAFGINIANLSNAGTIHSTYGVYVGRLTAGIQTNVPYSFFASDSNTYNYFAGNVGIGTTTPQYKLAVNGTIKTKEVIVTNSGWADSVFKPHYRLWRLHEVGAYIREHGRLPEIPSESEVREKGVSLGEMQVKLLAKIEELTLHMIQTDERNGRLEQRNLELQRRIARLEALAVGRR